ncbi:MAG: ribosome maturation factor RimP [Pseudomonadota bacterium]
MSVLEERIEKLVGPAISAAGFELVRIRITGKESLTLQIMAERPDHTMSAEDCARLSRALSPILEEADPIAGAYRLEVSSPGIDRPLVRLKDYHDWQGYEAKIEIDRMIEGRKKFKGVLAGVEGDNICLDVEGEEETALIPFAFIQSGKLVLTEELIRESLKAAKDAAKDAPQNDALKEKSNDHHGDLQ